MYIKVRAQAGSKKEAVKATGSDTLDICVREPAKGNRANKRIIEIVRGLYPNKSVRLVSGHASPHKIISIEE